MIFLYLYSFKIGYPSTLSLCSSPLITKIPLFFLLTFIPFSFDHLSIILIVFASFLTAIGKFDKYVEKFKCGLIIPTTGFAHSVQSASLDYKKEGLITGVGTNFFKLAGSVIVYGIVVSFFLSIIKVILWLL